MSARSGPIDCLYQYILNHRHACTCISVRIQVELLGAPQMRTVASVSPRCGLAPQLGTDVDSSLFDAVQSTETSPETRGERCPEPEP